MCSKNLIALAFCIAFVIGLVSANSASYSFYTSTCQQTRTCSQTQVQTSVRYHKVSYGCSSHKFESAVYGISFDSCCAQRDQCYSTCNSGKQNCDQQFVSCCQQTCNRCSSSVQYNACQSIATVMFRVTRTTTCSVYRREQQISCGC